MDMRKLFAVGAVFLVTSLVVTIGFFCASYRAMPNVVVDDARKAEVLILGAKSGNPYTHGVSIRGSGDIDGEATMSLMLNGEPYKVTKLRGRIDFEWGGDWYAETAEIRYEPVKVRSGKVVLHYRFYQ
jgi:hypothetical protein